MYMLKYEKDFLAHFDLNLGAPRIEFSGVGLLIRGCTKNRIFRRWAPDQMIGSSTMPSYHPSVHFFVTRYVLPPTIGSHAVVATAQIAASHTTLPLGHAFPILSSFTFHSIHPQLSRPSFHLHRIVGHVLCFLLATLVVSDEKRQSKTHILYSYFCIASSTFLY